MNQEQLTLTELAERLSRMERETRRVNDQIYLESARRSREAAAQKATSEPSVPDIFRLSVSEYIALPQSTKDNMMRAALKGALRENDE